MWTGGRTGIVTIVEVLNTQLEIAEIRRQRTELGMGEDQDMGEMKDKKEQKEETGKI